MSGDVKDGQEMLGDVLMLHMSVGLDWTYIPPMPNVNKVLPPPLQTVSLIFKEMPQSVCPPLQMASTAAPLALLNTASPSISDDNREERQGHGQCRIEPSCKGSEGGRPLGHFLSVADTAEMDGNRGYRPPSLKLEDGCKCAHSPPLFQRDEFEQEEGAASTSSSLSRDPPRD